MVSVALPKVFHSSNNRYLLLLLPINSDIIHTTGWMENKCYSIKRRVASPRIVFVEDIPTTSNPSIPLISFFIPTLLYKIS